jgi:hypothetical protein
MRTLVDIFIHRAKYFLGSQQRKAKRNKRNPVGKGKRKESVALKKTLIDVVIELGKEFEFTTSIFFIGRIVNDKDFSFIVRGEGADENNDFRGNGMQKTPPVVPWRIKKPVDSVACESSIALNGKPPKITLLEDEEKESLEDGKKAEALGFSSAEAKKSAR